MQCPNCGANVPPGDLFCGECGTRIVSEEKPHPPPPSVVTPPAETAKRGPPKGLLIGCGGLLAVVIIVGCIWGATVLLDQPDPTLTPTQVVQEFTKTPTPAPTSTSPPTATPEPEPTDTSTPAATPAEAAPAFELVAFASGVTDDDEPIDPTTTFPAGTTKVYAVFDFSGMQDGMAYDAYWYRDGEEELHKTWEWGLGETGTTWVNIFNDSGLTPGDFELELYVGDLLLLEGEFAIQAGVAGTASGVRFALGESDGLPLGMGSVFPYGITEVYVFFDYEGFGDVVEIESTWLRDDQVSASGPLDWTGQDSGTDNVRFFHEDPLLAGDYEWQLDVAGTNVASGRFRIEEAVSGWTAFASPALEFWLLYPDGWQVEEDEDGVTLLSDSPGEIGVLILAEELAAPITVEDKAMEVLDYFAEDYADLEVVYSDSGLMDGEQAVIKGARFTDEDGSLKGLILVQVNHGLKSYGLVGLSDADVADDFGGTMGDIADSFHFLGQVEPLPTTLLHDDFGDPTSGWDEKSDEDKVQGYRDGTYFISVLTTDWIVWDTAGYNFDDFTLQVDVQQTVGDENNSYGVILRYVDKNNFYRFGITGDGHFSLFKQEKDEWIAVLDWRESAYLNPLGEVNQLGAICQGNQIALYANGHELVSITDDSFAQGDVGLFAAAYDVPEIEAVFDNLWVTENP